MVGLFIGALVIFGTGAWGTLALFVDGPGSDILRILLASTYAVAGLAVLGAYCTRRFRWIARKEATEGYSSIKGFFKQYELIYIVGDERDLIRVRTNYRKNPLEEVYLYRLAGSIENAKRVFLGYLQTINELRDRPKFYNTLTANCTNVIWMHSRLNPDHLPFSWKILLSGFTPAYLYEQTKIRPQSFI